MTARDPGPRPGPRRRIRAGALLPVLVAAMTGCSGGGSEETPSPFADCAAVTTTPLASAAVVPAAGAAAGPPSAPAAGAAAGPPSAPAAGAVPAAAPAAGGGPDAVPVTLPDLRLPCFTGGREIALRELRGPAVVNLWASWCDPCRVELPVMQRLADRTAGRLTVLGVDTGDGREKGASFAAAAGVTMPTLVDADRRLLSALARITLPVTVFVDPAGRARAYWLPLDARSLAEQVRRHTGVTVTL